MSEQEENQKVSRKNQIIFVVISFIALAGFVFLAYFTLSREKTTASDALSQEQFEGSVEVSAQLQAECQQSAQKIAKTEDVSQLVSEFKSHAESCKDVYFVTEGESPFRKEGMYPDLSIDIAHVVAKKSPEQAIEFLEFTKTLPAWDFYLGPVSCDSKSVVAAYLESMRLPADKICIKVSDYKTKLVPEIEKGNFAILSQMLPSDQIVWLGGPESDAGCPEKISTVIDTLKKLTQGHFKVEQPAADNKETNDVNLSLKSGDIEKATLVFSTNDECLRIDSLLLPSLEIGE